MPTLFERLNDPNLVYNFQLRFGVKPVRKEFLDSDDSNDDFLDLKGVQQSGLINDFADDQDNDDLVSHRYNLRSRKTHVRSSSEWSTTSNESAKSSEKTKDYIVESQFFYWLFTIGAGLGNEMFYCIFFPYWFWNVDGYVCRRLVLTWSMIMYIGQALKDVIR